MKKPWHVLRKVYVPIIMKKRQRDSKKINSKAEKLKDYYVDDISLEILRLRERYNLENSCGSVNFALFLDYLIKQNSEIYIDRNLYAIQSFLIIYEEGNMFLDYTLKLLKVCGYGNDRIRLLEYQENMRTEELKENEKVMALVSKEKRDYLIAVYGENQIWNRFGEVLVGYTGNQYLDVFEPVKDEIIVDAGCCDGMTDLQFLEWGDSRIKRIYAFESDKSNIEKCRKFIKSNCDGRIILVPKGCWNGTTELYVAGGAGTPGSYLGEEGEEKIEVTTIDSVVEDEIVTFIKMDIEGAELNALKGAQRTIIKNRPRLAICVYHKRDDICDIPEYILSLVPEYRFYMRHYATDVSETVLYAYCP